MGTSRRSRGSTRAAARTVTSTAVPSDSSSRRAWAHESARSNPAGRTTGPSNGETERTRETRYVRQCPSRLQHLAEPELFGRTGEPEERQSARLVEPEPGQLA
jgi:hypothetical protein